MGIWVTFFVILMTGSSSATHAANHPSAAADGRRACIVKELSEELLGPTEEERQLLAEVKGNLRKIKLLSESESKKLNAAVIKRLEDSPIPPSSKTSKRKGTFSQQEINQLYSDVLSSQSVKKTLCGGHKQGGYIDSEKGFCFARAMAVHFKALQSGATNGNVKKIWVMGNLRAQGEDFFYHVATTVRADNGSWYVIDPDLNGPMLLSEWHDRMRGWNNDGKMRLYVTSAKRLFPTRDAKYSKDIFESEENSTEFYADFLDEIYKENTGHAGPWTKLRSKRKRARLIENALLGLGIGGAVGGAAYFINPLKSTPAPRSSSAPTVR